MFSVFLKEKIDQQLYNICNTMYKIMCVFTYTCSQKHSSLSDSITM